jgi:cytidine deaminase
VFIRIHPWLKIKMKIDSQNLVLAVAVVARWAGGPMPGGVCRQLLAEYAPAAKGFVADSADLKKIRKFTVKKLLPAAFAH